MILFWGTEVLASFADCLIGLLFVGDILGVQIKKYRDSIFLASMMTIGIIVLNRIRLISVLTMLFAAIGLIFCTYFMYKKGFGRVVTAVSSYILILYLQEYFLILAAEILFGGKGFRADMIAEKSLVRMLLVAFAKALLVLSYVLFRRYLRKTAVLPGRLLMGIMIVSGMFFNLRMELSRKAENNETGRSIVITCMSALALYFMLRYFEMKKQKKLEHERNYVIMKGYEDMLQHYHSNSVYYHDLRNHMLMIENLLVSREYKRAADYMNTLQEKHIEIGAYRWTGTEAVDFILNYKKRIAEQKGISFSIDADLVKIYEIAEIDLCGLFGNVLDNAIESCDREEGEKKIRISVRQVREMLLIKSVNSCKDPPLCRDGLPVTVKEDRKAHGWGMKSMKSITEKYGGTMQYGYKEGEFSVVVTFFF